MASAKRETTKRIARGERKAVKARPRTREEREKSKRDKSERLHELRMLLASGQYVSGVTPLHLAKRWNLAYTTVEGYACEAARMNAASKLDDAAIQTSEISALQLIKATALQIVGEVDAYKAKVLEDKQATPSEKLHVVVETARAKVAALDSATRSSVALSGVSARQQRALDARTAAEAAAKSAKDEGGDRGDEGRSIIIRYADDVGQAPDAEVPVDPPQQAPKPGSPGPAAGS